MIDCPGCRHSLKSISFSSWQLHCGRRNAVLLGNYLYQNKKITCFVWYQRRISNHKTRISSFFVHEKRANTKKLLPPRKFHISHQLCSLCQYGLWSFQTGGTKLERLLPKNQHTQRKYILTRTTAFPHYNLKPFYGDFCF